MQPTHPPPPPHLQRRLWSYPAADPSTAVSATPSPVSPMPTWSKITPKASRHSARPSAVAKFKRGQIPSWMTTPVFPSRAQEYSTPTITEKHRLHHKIATSVLTTSTDLIAVSIDSSLSWTPHTNAPTLCLHCPNYYQRFPDHAGYMYFPSSQ